MHVYFSRIDNYDFSDNENINNNNQLKEEEENNECLICLEKCNNTEKTIRFLSVISFHKELIKECECDCWVHSTCLEIWILQKKSCIICRNVFRENTKEIIQHREIYIPTYITTYITMYARRQAINIFIYKILFLYRFIKCFVFVSATFFCVLHAVVAFYYCLHLLSR